VSWNRVFSFFFSTSLFRHTLPSFFFGGFKSYLFWEGFRGYFFLLEMAGIAHSTSSHSCVISTGTLHLESRVVGAFFLFAWEGLNYLATVMTGHFNGNSINVRTFSMRASGLCDFRIFLFVFGFGLYFLVFNIFFFSLLLFLFGHPVHKGVDSEVSWLLGMWANNILWYHSANANPFRDWNHLIRMPLDCINI